MSNYYLSFHLRYVLTKSVIKLPVNTPTEGIAKLELLGFVDKLTENMSDFESLEWLDLIITDYSDVGIDQRVYETLDAQIAVNDWGTEGFTFSDDPSEVFHSMYRRLAPDFKPFA